MAACNTRHDNRQHFCRLGVSRTPNRSSMSLAVNFLTSSTRLAVELLDQHRGRGLADAAAVAVEIHLLERPLVVDLQFQADHVAAQRVGVLVRVRAVADTARDGTGLRSGPGSVPGRFLRRRGP